MPKKSGAPASTHDTAVKAFVSILTKNNPTSASSRTKICTLLSNAVTKYTEANVEAGFEQAEATSSSRLALESAFSTHAREQAKQGSYKTLPGLLDLVLQAATSDICETKTPFVMLEDLLEATTLDECKNVWELIEERRDIMCDPKFVPEDIKRNTKSKLALLRIANNLLRRLSHNNTEFCGRIVMFLAYVYPLNERSGVNLKGDVNTSNTTEYEEEVDFVIDEDGEEDSTSSIHTRDTTASDEDHTSTIDYNLYKRFWDVQRYASNPNLAYTDLNHWKEFRTNVDTMLDAFEGHALSSDQQSTTSTTSTTSTSSTSSSSSSSPSSSSTSNDSIKFNPKFLTNSRLLRLQLRDPELRRTFLSQVLILCERLTSQSSSVPLAFKAVRANEYLKNVKARAVNLLLSTPPNGKGFVQGVLHVLARERGLWNQWKVDKCPIYERFASSEQEEQDKTGRLRVVRSIVTKRRALSKGGGKKTTAGRRQAANATVKESTSLLWEASKTTNTERLAQAAERQKTVADALVEFRTRVQEAEDPDNGIEEEYHPKNEADFSWKALRSLSQNHLDLFEFLEKTDVEKAGSIKTAFEKLHDKESGKELKNYKPVRTISSSLSSSTSSSAVSSGSESSKVTKIDINRKNSITIKSDDEDTRNDEDSEKIKKETKKRKRDDKDDEVEKTSSKRKVTKKKK